MEKDYLTAREYAYNKGWSIQYVYKLFKTSLQPFVKQVDNRKTVDISALNASNVNDEFKVYSSELTTKLSTKLSTNSTKFSTNSTNKVETVENTENITSSSENEEEFKRINQRNEKIIDDLMEQIKDKDQQIKDLSNKIAELFENNQRLQLNYQILLTDGKETQYEEVNVQSASAEEIIEEKPKKGFFSRFFK